MEQLKIRFRVWLILFMIGLALSGLTAFPLVLELNILNALLGAGSSAAGLFPALAVWITRVHDGLVEISRQQPWMFYGTDWLAYAHLMITVAFIGPLRDPVRNKWIIDFGLIACLGIIPLALICGPIRGIPLFWQLIDCSFCLGGMVPLLICRHYIKKMETLAADSN